jgi:heat shock protein HslJ
VTSAAVTGNTTLTLTGDRVSLVFGRNAPEPDSPLEGRRWVLDTVVAGQTASTTFGGGLLAFDGGRLTGNGGCQDLTGTYTLDGGTLVATGVRLVAGPLTDCAREAVRQDETVREILAGRPTVKISGTRLTLTAGDRSLGFVDRGTTS